MITLSAICIANMELKPLRILQPNEFTYTWCSKHCDRTRHLWTGHRLICLECHPELDPEKEEDKEK